MTTPATPRTLPASFRRIRMELAREPGHPAGDTDEGYTLVAPLTGDGRIDANAWRANRAACRVVREHDGEKSIGHLVHGPGGVWRFQYDVAGDTQDETGFRLDAEQMTAGEYVSIQRADGVHTFRVTAVTAV